MTRVNNQNMRLLLAVGLALALPGAALAQGTPNPNRLDGSGIPASTAVADHERAAVGATDVDISSSYYQQNGNHSAVEGGVGTQHLTDVAPTIILTHAVADEYYTSDYDLAAFTALMASLPPCTQVARAPRPAESTTAWCVGAEKVAADWAPPPKGKSNKARTWTRAAHPGQAVGLGPAAKRNSRA